MQNISKSIGPFVFLALIAGHIYLTFPSLNYGAENLRVLQVVDVDEYVHTVLLRDCLARGSLRIDFMSYGHLYFNVALIPLSIINQLREPSAKAIILALRIVTLCFSIGLLALVYIFGKYLRRDFEALLACGVLVFGSPVFFINSTRGAPDIAQLFFLTAAIICCCLAWEGRGVKWAVWASASAGLAFATKFAGIFILPIIYFILVRGYVLTGRNRFTIKIQGGRSVDIYRFICVIIGGLLLLLAVNGSPVTFLDLLKILGVPLSKNTINIIQTGRAAASIIAIVLIAVGLLEKRLSIIRNHAAIFEGTLTVVAAAALPALVFIAAFSAASPCSWIDLSFMRGIRYESTHISKGHVFIETAGAAQWLLALSGRDLCGPVVAFMAAMSAALIAADRRNRLLNLKNGALLVMICWAAIFIGYAMLNVRMMRVRYLLPILPFLAILAAQSLGAMGRFAFNNMNKRWGCVFAMTVTIGLGMQLESVVDYEIERRATCAAGVFAQSKMTEGIWLEANLPSQTRIIYDKNVYVPEAFQNVKRVNGMTLADIREFNPEIIIVNRNVSESYDDANDASAYVNGPERFMESHRCYAAIRSDGDNYEKLETIGNVEIYRKRAYRSAE